MDIPQVYDPRIDAMRPATQADFDDLIETKRRLFPVRDLVLALAMEFPTIAADLVSGSKERNRALGAAPRAEGDAVRRMFNLEHSNA